MFCLSIALQSSQLSQFRRTQLSSKISKERNLRTFEKDVPESKDTIAFDFFIKETNV